MVVVAARVSYLNAAREMFADGGMGADVFAKKRIYLCAKEVGELRENGFLVLVYKCGQEKLNNLYYQVKSKVQLRNVNR